MTTIKQLKKISVKELFGLGRGDNGAENIKKLIEAGHKKIFRITGNVTGFGKKQTQFGESYVLTGQFLAQNLVSNEIFKSSKAYMPKDFTETVIANFEQRGDMASSVEFTAEVSVMKDSSVATGYTYDVSGIETAESMAWEAQAVQRFLALPAPVKKGKAA